jgi:hypothetical protein
LLSRDRTRSFVPVPALALALGASAAGAADWELAPKLELGYVYDNNYRLTPPDTENEVAGGLLDAEFELSAATPLTEFSFVPRVRSTYFPDDPDEDSNDYFGQMQWQRRTQRLVLGLRADYAQETVASSEQPSSDLDAGLGETGGADAGIVATRNRRELARLRPALSWEFSPRRRLSINASLADIAFDEQIPGAQTDYVDLSATLGFGFDVSPRSTFTVRAHASRYDVEIETNSADAYGLEAEWSTQSTQAVQTYLRAGVQRTIFNEDPLTATPADEVTNYLAGAGVRRSAGLTDLFLDVTHSVGPTASGFVVQRDQLRLRLTRLISPRFSVFGGLRGIQDRAVESDALYRRRQYATGDIGVEWRVRQQLSIVATADYTWQEFEGDPVESTSGGGMLSFVFEPRRRE